MFNTFLNSRLNRLTLALIILTAIAVFLHVKDKIHATRVEAVGGLDFTYLGVGLNDPVFEVTNMLPGDCQTRTIEVVNNALTLSKIAVKGVKTSEIGNLSTQLEIVVSEDTTHLYGGTSATGSKTVAEFFTDSNPANQIQLSNLGPGANTSYNFEVCFKTTAGNEFQNTHTIFDLKFGEILVPVDLPDECNELEGIVTQVITGTPGKDKIKGTGANEYIQGLDDNDSIEGGGGDDCILGGNGDDKIEGGTGRDIIIGGLGKDKIDGGTGQDIVIGNEENDDLKGGSESDFVYGNDGDDRINGGSGIDYLYGGLGEDEIDGGSDTDHIYGQDSNDKLDGSDGIDYLYGDAGSDHLDGGPDADFLYGGVGDDYLHGSSGDDFLDGQADIDQLHGNSGTDTCINGETTSSCEF